MNNTFKLITIGEAVKLLQVHPNTLRNWDKDGTFKSIRVGRRKVRRYKEEDIKKLINNEKEWNKSKQSNLSQSEKRYRTYIEVAQRKQAEEKLRESDEFNKSLLAALPFGMDIVDMQGNVLFMNNRFLSIFGNKSLGKKCWYIYKDNKKQCVNCPLKKTIEIGKTSHIESEDCLGGKTLLISHTGMRYKGRLAILEVFTDITKRKELERRKDEFISIASHELKIPLTSIKLNSQMIKNYLQKENYKNLPELAESMNKQINTMQGYVDEFLDVNKIRSGKLNLRKEKFDVISLIKEECRDLQEILKNHKLSCYYMRRKKITADKKRIRQVLINLITNAAKYSPGSKKIIIRSKIKDGEIIISIQDFGIGIAKDHQEKIFDKFFQVKEPAEKRFGGLGLGLFISKGIINQHGGKIWVESKKGKGSTFYFSLPI